MSQYDNHKGSAELEREVEAQRNRVESTLGEIKDRLTPGQLVDELLSYTKHGGAHFAANLGHTVTSNPLPAALLGVSLAWLMMGNGNKPQHHSAPRARDWNGYTPEPSYGRISGAGLKRVSHARDDAGEWYAEFSDDFGKKYRAKSNEHGHRTGNFIDETGKAFAGFFDEAGKRVDQFRDEAGNLLEDAAGWAAQTWHDATSGLSRAGGGLASGVADQAGHLADNAGHMIHDAQTEAARMTRQAMHVLEDQPLIGAALAFAAGAALGGVLPATRQEDELIGKTADEMKREAAHVASDLYEKGKEKVAEVYEETTEKAGEIYSDAKRKVTGQTGIENNGTISRH